LSQEVFAAALEIENPAVKSLVVRISEDCANPFFQFTLRTAGTLLFDHLGTRRTLVRTRRCGAFGFTVEVAGTTVTTVLPGLATGVGNSLVRAADGGPDNLGYLRSQSWKIHLCRGCETERATLIRSPPLVGKGAEQFWTGESGTFQGERLGASAFDTIVLLYDLTW